MRDVTTDAFLGGRITLAQPRVGYRAGVDPVVLAAAVPASAGQRVLELGCGAGVAALCLAARVPGVKVTGVELQPAYAALARQNAQSNALPVSVITADLRALPADLRQIQFDHVMMNPPYFERSSGTGSDDPGRDLAFGGDTPLADWISTGTKRVAPKGYLTLIQRMERLPEVLSALSGRLGSVVLRPLAGRRGKPPERFLLQARRDGKAPFQMAPTLILHRGDSHLADAESYTPEVSAVLREAAALPLLP